jgi:hypothetical protein
MHEFTDPEAELGAHRRALLAQLVRGGLPGEERRGTGRGRHARRAHPAPAPSDPQADAELRGRIQARLGRLVSHPRALHVQVSEGVVRLTGRVLAKECDGLLEQVRQMPGVQQLVNEMSAHDTPHEIASRGPAAVPLDAATR